MSAISRPPEWLPTSSDGSPIGMFSIPLDLAAEVGAADRLEPRQRAADVLGVPGVDRVGGEALDELLDVGERAGGVLEQAVERGRAVAGEAAEGVVVRIRNPYPIRRYIDP